MALHIEKSGRLPRPPDTDTGPHQEEMMGKIATIDGTTNEEEGEEEVIHHRSRTIAAILYIIQTILNLDHVGMTSPPPGIVF
jgi:hypothetical protein